MAILFDNPNNYKVLGCFTEKDFGRDFTFAENPDNVYGHFSYGYPHIVFVNDLFGQTFRYAGVLKTVAYIIVDEDSKGLPVEEKWNIKQNNFVVS